MATKPTTLYSTNPKMDMSGVRAKMPQMGYDMRPLPPKEVKAAFDDVIRAKEDKERLKNQAETYANCTSARR